MTLSKTPPAPSTRPAAKFTTEEAAERMRNRPQTWRAAYCRNGHYLGILPTKGANNRLLWPAAEVDALVAGRPAKTPDATDIDKHLARKAAEASKRPAHIVRKAEEAKAKRLAALTAGEVAQ